MKGNNRIKVVKFIVLKRGLSYVKARLTLFLRQKHGLALSLIILLNGCATLSFPEYEAQPFNYNQHSQIKDGLTVAVRPMTNKQEVKRYFGASLVSANILPVFVIVENRRVSSSFILSKDQISFQTDESTTPIPSGRDNIGDDSTGRDVMVAGQVLLSPLLLIIAGEMIAEADAITANAVNKELTSKTISPGQLHKGFVYFQLPKDNITPQRWILHINFLNHKSRKLISFDLPFQFKKGTKESEIP